jgi:hypothetical protein
MGEGWDALHHRDGGGPLPAAHAHNDMDNGRPLIDALAHGFTSVEADVWLTYGSLRVGHWPQDASSSRNTLDRLYLRPLQTRMSRSSGGPAVGRCSCCWTSRPHPSRPSTFWVGYWTGTPPGPHGTDRCSAAIPAGAGDRQQPSAGPRAGRGL